MGSEVTRPTPPGIGPFLSRRKPPPNPVGSRPVESDNVLVGEKTRAAPAPRLGPFQAGPASIRQRFCGSNGRAQLTNGIGRIVGLEPRRDCPVTPSPRVRSSENL